MMLMRWSRQKQVVEAAVMVMPRSCSCSIQSIVAVPSCDLAHLVGHARVEQDALGGRGLPRVDVRHDPDVPGLRYGECHEPRLPNCLSDAQPILAVRRRHPASTEPSGPSS